MGKYKTLLAITPNQLNALIEAVRFSNNINTAYHKFLKARLIQMWVMQYFMGLRPKEVYAAKINYVDYKNKRFYIPASSNKNRYQDNVKIPDQVFSLLIKYLNLKNKVFPSSEWLFPSRTDTHYGRSCYSKIFKKYIKKIGLHHTAYVNKRGLKISNYTPYSLRAGYGTYVVYMITRDIKKTSIALRHRDRMMRTTLKYVILADNILRDEIIDEIFNQQTDI